MQIIVYKSFHIAVALALVFEALSQKMASPSGCGRCSSYRSPPIALMADPKEVLRECIRILIS